MDDICEITSFNSYVSSSSGTSSREKAIPSKYNVQYNSYLSLTVFAECKLMYGVVFISIDYLFEICL